jgi:acetoin utilization protein AcuB
MLVQDIMQQPVVTATTDTTVAEAYRKLHDEGIRHLPVLEAGRLEGVVTDRDLRYATSRLHPSPREAEAPLHEVMTDTPITASPLDPIEEAARILRKKRIGCLPVIDDDELVGIVTTTNLLDAVVRLTGLEKPGGRLSVSLPDEPGQLARLTTRVADEGLDIRSVLSYYESADEAPHDEAPGDEGGPSSRLRVILRLDTINVRPLADALRREGFRVVWPMEKPA